MLRGRKVLRLLGPDRAGQARATLEVKRGLGVACSAAWAPASNGWGNDE